MEKIKASMPVTIDAFIYEMARSDKSNFHLRGFRSGIGLFMIAVGLCKRYISPKGLTPKRILDAFPEVLMEIHKIPHDNN
jgi:hypothetical protein